MPITSDCTLTIVIFFFINYTGSFLYIQIYIFFLAGQVGYHENEEELRVPLLGNMLKGATIGQYNKLLWSLAENMTTDVFNRIKRFVKGKNHKHDQMYSVYIYLDKT